MLLSRKRLFDEETDRAASPKSLRAFDNAFLAFLAIFAVIVNRFMFSIEIPGREPMPYGVPPMIIAAVSDLYDNVRMVAAAVLGSLWWPLLAGLGTAVCMWSLVYLDSDRPGVRPPSPLRPPPKCRYRSRQPLRTCHLNYMMSLASGALVFGLLLNSE